MTIEVPDDLFEQLADRISEKLWQRREDARIGFMKVDEAAVSGLPEEPYLRLGKYAANYTSPGWFAAPF